MLEDASLYSQVLVCFFCCFFFLLKSSLSEYFYVHCLSHLGPNEIYLYLYLDVGHFTNASDLIAYMRSCTTIHYIKGDLSESRVEKNRDKYIINAGEFFLSRIIHAERNKMRDTIVMRQSLSSTEALHVPSFSVVIHSEP